MPLMRKHWPLLLVLLIFWLAAAGFVNASMKKNQGHLVYALDDAYIHMAIAKNFSRHGTWGVTRHEFSNSSTSILWPLLLSLIYKILGVHEAAPFALNLLFASMLICAMYAFMRKREIDPFHVFLGLVTIIMAGPLLVLLFSGMEHIFHILMTVLFFFTAARMLTDGQSRDRADFIKLYLLASLLTASRYEGCFLVFIAAVFFFMKKNFKAALGSALAGAAPVVVFGLFSLANGWSVLPNSIVLKADLPHFTSWRGIVYSLGYAGLKNMAAAPEIHWLVIASAILFFYRHAILRKSTWDETKVSTVMFLLACLSHMQFIRANMLGRYEAYLVVLGLLILASAVPAAFPGKSKLRISAAALPAAIPLLLITALVFLSFQPRVKSNAIILQATTNIFLQQYQMGLFVKEFYNEQKVAVNDIGAVCYLSDARCIDLVGLGTMKIAARIAAKTYAADEISKIASEENVKAVIAYDEWYYPYGGLPQAWSKVGQWTIPDNRICGSATVSFFAIDSPSKDTLIKNLRSYSFMLPDQVSQTGIFQD